MQWKTILMRSFWYQKFEDPTIHVTVGTSAKFWGLKFQNGFTHAKLRGRDPIFRYCPIIQTCSFTWASQNKFSTTLQISGFISTESQYTSFDAKFYAVPNLKSKIYFYPRFQEKKMLSRNIPIYHSIENHKSVFQSQRSKLKFLKLKIFTESWLFFNFFTILGKSFKSVLNCGSGLDLKNWMNLFQSRVPGPGPVWRCQGQSGVPGPIRMPGPVWGVDASLGCQRQSGMPAQVWGAKVSLKCLGQSGANTNLRCHRQCEMPGPIWDARANVKCMLHQVCYQVTCATQFIQNLRPEPKP